MFDLLFINILNLSYTASFVIVFVILARFLMKKLPKLFLYILWLPVLFKLICPFSFESILGLLPQKTTPISSDIIYKTTPQINTGFSILDSSINSILPSSPEVGNSVNPIQIWLFIAEIIWLVGILALITYSVVTLIKLKLNLKVSVRLKDNIYIADHITSPFVLGIIKPKIYLPSNLSEYEKEYIIAHEQTHIKRLDNITRLIAFAVVCVHWFNPLVWLAFILSAKDMEMSCDEAVINKMDNTIKADYSTSILRFAMGKKAMRPTTLAFSQSDTKSRVKNIMKYKKPLKITGIILAVVIVVFSVFLISKNAPNKNETTPPTPSVSSSLSATSSANQKNPIEESSSTVESYSSNQSSSTLQKPVVVKNNYDTLEIFTLVNVQSGKKLSTTITNKVEIEKFINYFESGTIENDSDNVGNGNPYYYRFFKNGELQKEYIFQNDDYTFMYVNGSLKNVEYTKESTLPHLKDKLK